MRRDEIAGRIVLAIIVLLFCVLAAKVQAQSFTCLNEKDKKKPCLINAERADQVYWAVVQQIARDINPSHPPKLRPRIVVHLQSKDEAVNIGPDLMEVFLKKWDEDLFAHAVGFAASTQLLPKHTVQGAVKRALLNLGQTVSVEELQRK